MIAVKFTIELEIGLSIELEIGSPSFCSVLCHYERFGRLG